ncbi:MAG: hypothetical protein JW751_26765 [Polyangiaceae bacterium]|nr:hypothetical protein [Polyangiaceae bacterium]
MAVQSVFSGGAPEPPCPADRAARVLVTGDDEAARLGLAEKAGCVAQPTGSRVDVQLWCPAALDAPSATRTGGATSCEAVQQEYVASYDPGAGKAGRAPEAAAGTYVP